MGEKAALAANDGPVAEGNVGAGTGATVGKIFGMKQAMKSGIGSASLTLGSGVVVAALVAVNALGDVIDPANGQIVAGARKSPTSREFANSAAVMRHGWRRPGVRGNTTLAVVATNAALDRVQTNKLAALGSLGVARTISPVNTMSMAILRLRSRSAKSRRRWMRWGGGRRSHGDGGSASGPGREDGRRRSRGWPVKS